MRKLSKTLSTFNHLFFILLIFSFAILATFPFGFWLGYPSGYDAPSHVFRVKFVAQFWPHIEWVPVWAHGMPLFMRYPALPYIILGLLTRFTSFTAEQVLAGAGVFAVGLGGTGLYLFIHQLTKSKVASLTGAILYAFTPVAWLMGETGGYARAYAVPFMILALWATTVVVEDLVKKKRRYWPYLLTVLFLGICFLFHYIVGLFAFLLIGFWLLGFWRIVKLKVLFSKMIKIFIPAALIASPLWLPILVLRIPNNGLAVGSINWEELRKGIPWQHLFNFYDPVQKIGPYGVQKLTPFLYPLAAFLWLLAFVIKKGKMATKTLAGRAVLLLTILSVSSLIYARFTFRIFKVLYAGLLGHTSILLFTPIFVASLVGILISKVFSRKWQIATFSVLVIGGMLVWISYQYRYQIPHKLWEGLNISVYDEFRYPFVEKVIDNPKDFNYRFGTSTDAGMGAWFNTVYPFVPQTRDYSGQSVVNVDAVAYETHAVWLTSDNYPETEFILDWFGIKTILTSSLDEEVEGKYEAQPETYKLLEEYNTFKVFEYASPNPILLSTNTPTALVISKDAHDVIYRSLAQGNINSQYLIPIIGEGQIDDYKIDELKNFDFIILYNYLYKDKESAFDLLAQYVRQGGSLFIESNLFIEEGQSLPEPFPVKSVQKQVFAESWNLAVNSELGEIDLTSFSPPVYQEGPWGGAVAENLKGWGEVLVSHQGKPLVAGGQLGKGRVVWSGMNLPYHILNNRNQEEAKLLERILAWTKGKSGLEQFKTIGQAKEDLTYESENFTAQFINPQEFKITLKKPVKGALFKGFYFFGWKAKAVLQDGKSQPISLYKAGPGMMYVQVPVEAREIIFYYRLPKITVLSRLAALLTIIFLLFRPSLRKLPLFSFIQNWFGKYKAKIGNWWNKDEV